jgi:putative spermidine/putrescine transport system permease protein
MWDGINERVDPTIAAAATTLFLITLLLIGLQALRAAKVNQSQQNTAS